MAIQIPNVGTGVPADQTGDSPWLAMQKVADNFSDQSNAASRLVGEAKGNIPEFTSNGINDSGWAGVNTRTISATSSQDLLDQMSSTGVYNISANSLAPYGTYAAIMNWANNNNRTRVLFSIDSTLRKIVAVYKSQSTNAEEAPFATFYTDKNTTTDSNGFIKAASPIVKVFADKVELNDDAAAQDVTFIKNGVGDYTITTVSGLSTDGWYIELPLDLNGNPKVAVTLTETDGTIELKCYKRTFNMTTFVFEPDLDEPLDIPDERWIDLRLNEIEHEAPTMPDVDLDKKD